MFRAMPVPFIPRKTMVTGFGMIATALTACGERAEVGAE